jgi:serine/threonine protein phosphatase 1
MAITRFLNRLKPIKPYPPLAPREQPLCIIGDIHGCADLLDELVLQICTQGSVQGMRVVLVGDLIDRGPDSAGVLARVRDWCAKPAPFAEVICLMGNHEAMMLDFLAEPTLHGPRWLAHGGDTTLQSFGLSPYQRSNLEDPTSAGSSLITLRDGLRQAMPEGLEDWLTALPLLWQDQDLVVTHAGADPARPIIHQLPKDLLWGHLDFRSRQRQDGLWVAHGHVITRHPTAQGGRIAVDTGAWRTGRLTAALLDQDGLHFVETTASK